MKQILLYFALIALLFVPMNTVCSQSSPNENTQIEVVSGDTLSDTGLRISLVTCSGGADMIYTLFGHSGIRVQTADGGDYFFNYGLFDFSAPNFIWRYLLGETDYVLGEQPFESFVQGNARSWKNMREQRLNLTPEESERLFESLRINALPENCVYRYNYFYDNCATRPRIMIERAVNGIIVYPRDSETQTFRQAVHQYTAGFPWMELAIDLCLGADADKQMIGDQRLFIPDYLHDAVAFAKYVPQANAGDSTINSEPRVYSLALTDSLLRGDENSLTARPNMGAGSSNTANPVPVVLIVLLLVVGATIFGILKSRTLFGIDIALFAIMGLAGCILAFLALFSQHPAVQANWNLVVFHPIHLLYLPFFILNARRERWDWYPLVIAGMLTVFLLTYMSLPQKLPNFTMLCALILWVRAIGYLIINYGAWRK